MRIPLTSEDLANTRFAFSPVWEAVASYWALHDPSRHALHLPWIREATPRVEELDLPLLDALLRGSTTYPDFLTPAPETPLPNFDLELSRIESTPAEIVLSDLDEAYGSLDDADRARFRAFVDDPEGAVHALAGELAAYFEAALADVWPRMRSLLEADVTHRARTLALEGPEPLFSGLSNRLRFADGALELLPGPEAKGEHCLVHLPAPNPRGRGLILIPSVFTKAYVIAIGSHARETIQYRARGAHQLWYPDLPEASERLEHLLGSSRARLLKHLVAPATPSDLADRLQVTSSAVSQQLGWLRDAGLVQSLRQGRHRTYELSHIGHTLLSAYEELQPASAG